ncbi:MAG: EamA family transporter, partial [Pseudomonadota bacterium]
VVLEPGGVSVASWSELTILLIGFVGLSSGVGYLMWLYALANAPAGIVTAFLAFSPLTAVTLSVFLLGVTATAPLLIALILIIGGLVALALSPKSVKPL